jgi:hypothetical protein
MIDKEKRNKNYLLETYDLPYLCNITHGFQDEYLRIDLYAWLVVIIKKKRQIQHDE